MMSSTTEEKRPREMPVYVCPICGDSFRGNGYGRHEAACRRKQELGSIKKLYPIPLPTARYDAFSAWCERQGITLAEGVDRLIHSKLGI